GRIETRFADAKWKAINKGISVLNRDERENFAFFIALLANRRAGKIKAAAMEAADRFSQDLGDKLFSVDEHEADCITKGLGNYIALRASMEFAAEVCQEIARLEWRIIDFS